MQEYKKRDLATVIKNLQRLNEGQNGKEVKVCMVLETILLQTHIKNFVYKVVNAIAGMKIEGKITF